jgi:benzoyl-CoA 2,3-dioxygenase component A
MSEPAFVVQHLIDPEICIRCNTCEETCPVGAITHDDNNYVVNADTCNHCKACVAPCPTGAVDRWQAVARPYSLEAQFGWLDLPQQTVPAAGMPAALPGPIAPPTAATPTVQLYGRTTPATATVLSNRRATRTHLHDVRHIVLDFGGQRMPLLEGQSIGILPPGVDERGRPNVERLYSVASARGGEENGTNTVALTVKREPSGLCSNYLADLRAGDRVQVTGPFGTAFLLPQDPEANLLMVCTGTGVAPFRGFIEQRLRAMRDASGALMMFYGGRTPEELPYYGRHESLPAGFLDHHICFSREPGLPRVYVQDRMRVSAHRLQLLLLAPTTHVFICGRKGMEAGVEEAFEDILRGCGGGWAPQREAMRLQGRFHVETY